uniref:Uncharacterized protein n=1 Tax=Cryptomonas curvata TaxID=233186 RepID=A0A7S0MKX0_9CRYP|mmetsp:Transcript_4645/g.10280  ORF Transcript_4645/g.10280 Transcript_4645/m.10280 type:complete len:167 (+) Transcript_4645:80-580(+)
MSTQTLLAQDDFSCLELATCPDAESQSLDYYAGLTTVERAGSGDSSKSESACGADEIYLPVNFIPDEVYELIRNWELAYLQQHEPIQANDFMDTESSTDPRSSESIFEPMRLMSVSEPPPKRFFRTFWRSVTRRILRLEKQSALNRAAMSSSDASDEGSSTSRDSE